MELKLENITPELAESLLENNEGNRQPSKKHVNFLAAQITDGAWKVTGDTIKIAASGRVLDGQHRLMAIVKAGVAVETFVARNVAEETFQVIDTGKVRSARDVLTIADLPCASMQATVGRDILMFRTGTIKRRERNTTHAEILEFCKGNELMPHISQATMWHQKGAPLKTTEMAVLSFLLSEVAPDEAKEFLDKLCLGYGIQYDSAPFKLREKLTKAILGRYDLSKWEAIALVIKTWNIVRTSSAVPSIIVYNPDKEEFPKPL